MLKLPHGICYIASPYSDVSDRVRACRYEAVVAFAAVALTNPAFADCIIYSPIIAWHEAAVRHSLPTHAAFWADENRKTIRMASSLVVVAMEGWKQSVGVSDEIACFAAKGIQPLLAHIDNGDVVLWKI